MLHSWVDTVNNRRHSLPYSFSDRGDVWPMYADDMAVSARGRHDLSAIAEGLIAGTLVATEMGWQPVEDLRTGDRVVTFDNGMRPLKAAWISTLWTAESHAPRSAWPLEVPVRALGNRQVIRLLPKQAILFESDEAEALYGDPFTMINASVLDGYKGIARVPPAREMTVVSLEFEGDEVVYVNGTTLVHCPSGGASLVTSAEEMMSVGSDALYQCLTDVQGRHLVEALRDI